MKIFRFLKGRKKSQGLKNFAITIFFDFTPAAGAAAHALYAKFYGSPPHPRAHRACIICVERGMQLKWTLGGTWRPLHDSLCMHYIFAMSEKLKTRSSRLKVDEPFTGAISVHPFDQWSRVMSASSRTHFDRSRNQR